MPCTPFPAQEMMLTKSLSSLCIPLHLHFQLPSPRDNHYLAFVFVIPMHLSLSQSVQKLSCVRLFVTPWTTARQASLSITNSWNLLKLMSIELVMPSNHLILCHPFLLLPSIFPSIRSFPLSQFFTSGGQSIGASASVLPMNIQD